jgi:hypothetical protein
VRDLSWPSMHRAALDPCAMVILLLQVHAGRQTVSQHDVMHMQACSGCKPMSVSGRLSWTRS